LLALALVLVPISVSAQPGRTRLTYTFQPDCFHTVSPATCDPPGTQKRLDLGPQIAVWLEKADGSFVTDLLVTNLTAVRGIGNRPGVAFFPSTWRFPYGKRVMVLPVWAHRRGKLYPQLVIQDDGGGSGGEMGLGFHEAVSSPDPYYCLSFKPSNWVFQAPSVDAITCATSAFSSAKGKFSGEMTYYPPRNDLNGTTLHDCPTMGGECPVESRAASHFAEMNDLDAVAAATPLYGHPFSATWEVPLELPAGDYAVLLEINKEFDTNPSHTHTSFVDNRLPEAGLINNLGQPSVVFRAPIRIDHTASRRAAVTNIAGYGDWDGATGTLHPPDETISDDPGSGRGRLLVIKQPSAATEPLMGRLHVMSEVEQPVAPDAGAPDTASEDAAGEMQAMGGASGTPDAGAPAPPVANAEDSGCSYGGGGASGAGALLVVAVLGARLRRRRG
jgi:hypothetical protein